MSVAWFTVDQVYQTDGSKAGGPCHTHACVGDDWMPREHMHRCGCLSGDYMDTTSSADVRSAATLSGSRDNGERRLAGKGG